MEDVLFESYLRELDESGDRIEGVRLVRASQVGFGDYEVFELDLLEGGVVARKCVAISAKQFDAFDQALEAFEDAADALVEPLAGNLEMQRVFVNGRTCELDIINIKSGQRVWSVAQVPSTISQVDRAIRETHAVSHGERGTVPSNTNLR